MDKTVLEEKADFTISLPIPEKDYAVKNVDGSTPSVSLKIDATSFRFAFAILRQVDEGQEMLNIIADDLVGENFADLVKTQPDFVTEKLTEIHDKFITFAGTFEAEGGESMTFELSGPSGLIAYKAFSAMVAPQKLSQIAINLMPREDDDEDNFYDDYEDDYDDGYDEN